jgi:hypothetical protein
MGPDPSQPYALRETIVCQQEGFLLPLRCDIDHELLDALGNVMLDVTSEDGRGYSVLNTNPSHGPDPVVKLAGDKFSRRLRLALEKAAEKKFEDIPELDRVQLLKGPGLPRGADWRFSGRLRSPRGAVSACDVSQENVSTGQIQLT